jgi:hypothetical protein
MSLHDGRFRGYINKERHTRSSLPDLLRHDAKDREYLNHDLDDDVRHSCGRPDLYIFFKPLKKVFQAAKQVHKSILASADILNGLDDRSGRCHQTTHAGSRKMLTWRRTPIPAKIVFAGENICGRACQRVDVEWPKLAITSPTPLPRVAENAYKTLTVGSSHFNHFSSTL